VDVWWRGCVENTRYRFRFWKVIRIRFDLADAFHERVDARFRLISTTGGADCFYLFWAWTDSGTVVRYVREYAREEYTGRAFAAILYTEPALGDSLELLNRRDSPDHMHLPSNPLGIPSDAVSGN